MHLLLRLVHFFIPLVCYCNETISMQIKRIMIEYLQLLD